MHGTGVQAVEDWCKLIQQVDGLSFLAGAGFAGLAAANRLASKGIPVTVYDMGSRGPGASMHPHL